MGKPILKPIKSVYNSFSGHAIPLKGEKIVNVNYNDQELDLQLIVGNENCNNILGRNWINALHLNETTLDE
ncbi:unnamed protein product, partial [Rotaria socialis]